jgi:heme-degrading monooxygenase HmoA
MTKEKGQLYTCGFWKVKPGHTDTFIQAWGDFARWSAENHPGVGQGRLLQDADKSDEFLSFGPWQSEDHIQAWRDSVEFKDFVERARQLCESFQPHTMRQVASSSVGEA